MSERRPKMPSPDEEQKLREAFGVAANPFDNNPDELAAAEEALKIAMNSPNKIIRNSARTLGNTIGLQAPTEE